VTSKRQDRSRTSDNGLQPSGLGEDDFEPGEPTNLVDYVGPRYGEASDASREAIELAARTITAVLRELVEGAQ